LIVLFKIDQPVEAGHSGGERSVFMDTDTTLPAAARMTAEAMHDLGLPGDGLRIVRAEHLPSRFAVGDLAVASLGSAALALADLAGGDAVVDGHLAAAWFRYSLAPVGWSVAPPWDAIAGDYACADGWIRLHTNAPHHLAAALRVLGCAAEREAVAAVVARWSGVALIALQRMGSYRGEVRPVDPARPLRGIRVLDLTRVLAGPVATRFLAGLGADVLRIDPPDWDEPAVVPDVTLGKRCARLDLRLAEHRARFEALLGEADMLVHGYRPGALDGLGFGEDWRRAVNPGLIDVSLCAWGWTGPWAGRRGFDSLVQMAAGIADGEPPAPLPVQALDHATGYFMAAAALRGLAIRQREAVGSRARLSLARTAHTLTQGGAAMSGTVYGGPQAEDWSPVPEATPWGPARRLLPPVAGLRWDLPASALGAVEAGWG
jgi:hypothetical protein